MFKSPFEEKKDLIVVSDAFVQQYNGGAEMTLESFLDCIKEKYNIKKINCSDLTIEIFNELDQNYKNSKWLFGNISNLSANVLNTIIFKLKNYSIIECDYKYCRYRSEELHLYQEGKECDCIENLQLNYLISTFYSKAKNLFWMSENQKSITNSKLRIVNVNQIVLSSIFAKDHINYIKTLKSKTGIKRNDKYIVLRSPSWVKGYEAAIKYCKKNNLSYEEVWGLDYQTLLNKLRESKGLVYLPRGKDTCPRLVIEAKLLGCELILNKNVQHKDDEWFKDTFSIYSHFLKNKKLLKEIF